MTWSDTERAIEHLRMHALSAETVQTDQLVVLTSELRLALDEIERLQKFQDVRFLTPSDYEAKWGSDDE